MRQNKYTDVCEYYRVANIIYDMGYREGEKTMLLQRYYSPHAIEVINRFMKIRDEEERKETEKFFEEWKKIYK